jgi:hypothetical protein
MYYMKFAILFLAIFLVSIATVVYAESNSFSQILPKDEPNFKPTISNGTFNGKDVQIIEFKSKIGT